MGKEVVLQKCWLLNRLGPRRLLVELLFDPFGYSEMRTGVLPVTVHIVMRKQPYPALKGMSLDVPDIRDCALHDRPPWHTWQVEGGPQLWGA